MTKYQLKCRYFSGYKPCKFKRSCEGCPHLDIPEQRVIIVSLEALGAVLRTTCLLEPIKKAFPRSHITWLTLPASNALLLGNPLIDRVMLYSDQVLPIIDHLEFDVMYVVDKSPLAGSLAHRIKAKQAHGFGLSPEGAIIPLSASATYQYDVGLDDDLKFFKNQKPETQQITETMGLTWERAPYVLEFTEQEQKQIAQRRREVKGSSQGVIGYSTGCSLLYPYKKFTVETAIEMVRLWRRQFPNHVVALFGGREDAERNHAIKQAFSQDEMVLLTPTGEGLRSGILWMASADLILTGCSLGLHISIALKKKTITWFGVSCAQEIDLYDLGVKLQADVGCSPCWKKSCDQSPKCYDQVDLNQIVHHTGRLLSIAIDE